MWWYLKPTQTNANELTLYGNVDIRQFNVSFQVPGQVTHLYFEEGDTVKKGDLMAEINDADYVLQEAQSESQVAQAHAAMVQAKSLYEKYAILYQQDAIAKQTFENSENTYHQMEAAYETTVKAKDLQTRQTDYSKLYALENGVVTARLVEPGTVVAKGTAIYTLTVPSPIWIRAYIDEKDLGNVYDGMAATITTDSVDPQTGKKKTYKGHIGYISPVSEYTPKSVQATNLRTDLVYMTRIYIDDVDKFLHQGMPATVTINIDSHGTTTSDTTSTRGK